MEKEENKAEESVVKQKIAKLIDVKSIMTLLLTAGFIGMTCAGHITGTEFMDIFKLVVVFYFGTQSMKNSQK